MKNSNNHPMLIAGLLLCGAGLLLPASKISAQQTSIWVAPKEADLIKNPLEDNLTAAKEGKKLYLQNCAVCHGDKGKGDGIAAAGLTPKPANHTSDKVQNQSDGAIFWKMTTGRPPMASYKEALTETQRWQLVNYIRTLKTPDKLKTATAKN
ncbi:MAG TPA: cytochrome c [Bacteroidia bacterium]